MIPAFTPFKQSQIAIPFTDWFEHFKKSTPSTVEKVEILFNCVAEKDIEPITRTVYHTHDGGVERLRTETLLREICKSTLEITYPLKAICEDAGHRGLCGEDAFLLDTLPIEVSRFVNQAKSGYKVDFSATILDSSSGVVLTTLCWPTIAQGNVSALKGYGAAGAERA